MDWLFVRWLFVTRGAMEPCGVDLRTGLEENFAEFPPRHAVLAVLYGDVLGLHARALAEMRSHEAVICCRRSCCGARAPLCF